MLVNGRKVDLSHGERSRIKRLLRKGKEEDHQDIRAICSQAQARAGRNGHHRHPSRKVISQHSMHARAG